MEIRIEALKQGLAICQFPPQQQQYLLDRFEKYQELLGTYSQRLMEYWDKEALCPLHPLEFLQEPDASAFFLILYCLLVEKSREIYARKKIPDEIWQATIPDVRWHLHEAPDGELWLDTVPTKAVAWHETILKGKVIQLGRLQFEIIQSSEDYPCYDILKGDTVINVHIPAMGRMNPQECEASFQKAKEFYEPRIGKVKAFYCHSWLLNPIFKKYLPPTSNIVQFQNLGTVFPDKAFASEEILHRVFYYYRENPLNPNVRTSLQRIVQTMLLRREPMNSGIMIRPWDR